MIVYTAISGDYKLRVPPRKDMVVFNAKPTIFNRPVMEAKRYKILSHLFFPDEDITIWIDGNIGINVEPQELVDRYLQHSDMAVRLHPVRKTVWEEFDALKKDARMRDEYLQTQLREQERAYRGSGILGDKGRLYECNLIIRRNTREVARLNEAWWAEICRWQWRDQVSFPFALYQHWTSDLQFREIADKDIRDHPDFTYVWHY